MGYDKSVWLKGCSGSINSQQTKGSQRNPNPGVI